MFRARTNLFYTVVFSAALFAVGACTRTSSIESSSVRSLEAYCTQKPVADPRNPVTISGQALYEYRVGGNGVATDSGVSFTVMTYPAPATNRDFSIQVDGRTYVVTSAVIGALGQADVVGKFKTTINADLASGLFAYGQSQLTVTKPGSVGSPAVGSLSRMTHVQTNPAAKPVRQAEIAVRAADGQVVQCTETKDDGSFQLQLDRSNTSYVVELRSRSNNERSMAYVLDNPAHNTYHSVQTTVTASDHHNDLVLRARVHEGLIGGAFNILDQLLNAQDFLRSTTKDCDRPGAGNYFPGCTPFTGAPMIYAFWSAGVSPGVYVGTIGSISYYLNGRHELYIQGGMNGNTTSSDMDHFDNSVILHEYAHFLEDVFGQPNSPGGTHNGDSIVDPRLAWGEGWANYFQAAVTGVPVYRDTYGSPDCTSSCAGIYFNESLDPIGRPNNDAPTPGATGEGNFREFSVSRLLWDATKSPGGVTSFAEIWRAFVLPGDGMHEVVDPFKSIGRFHAIQSNSPGATDWSGIRGAEEQVAGFSVYGNGLALLGPTCPTSPVSMAPTRANGDIGSFGTADHYRNNDYYRFDHAGGSITLELIYDKSTTFPADLDLYLYRPNYVLGRATDMALSSSFNGDGCPATGNPNDLGNSFRGQNGCPAPPSGLSSTYGYERMSGAVPAGTYMLDVFADVSQQPGAPTQYMLFLNGQLLCPLVN